MLPGIPGLAALASLKRASVYVCFVELVKGIPGLAALASLKLRKPTDQSSPSTRDSGACCPGLIEAAFQKEP